MRFSDAEKIALFDKIAEQYYNRNFGTLMKADLDVMIFSAYIDNKVRNGQPRDDYTISKELGLTESRVRALKERKNLKYPDENYNWKEEFVKLIQTAVYDKNKELVQIPIEDAALMKEIRHYFYQMNWFDEPGLNSKLLQCKLDFFLKFCISFDETEVILSAADKDSLKMLSNQSKDMDAIDKIIEGDFKGGFNDLIKAAPEYLLNEVLEKIPFGSLAKMSIEKLINIIIRDS